jgi:hypothetical protein
MSTEMWVVNRSQWDGTRADRWKRVRDDEGGSWWTSDDAGLSAYEDRCGPEEYIGRSFRTRPSVRWYVWSGRLEDHDAAIARNGGPSYHSELSQAVEFHSVR